MGAKPPGSVLPSGAHTSPCVAAGTNSIRAQAPGQSLAALSWLPTGSQAELCSCAQTCLQQPIRSRARCQTFDVASSWPSNNEALSGAPGASRGPGQHPFSHLPHFSFPALPKIVLSPLTLLLPTSSINRFPRPVLYHSQLTKVAAQICREEKQPGGSLPRGLLSSAGYTCRHTTHTQTPLASGPQLAREVAATYLHLLLISSASPASREEP